MKLLYLADIRFPMERANGIQTVETCHALARRGIDVDLVVRRSDARSDVECLFFSTSPRIPTCICDESRCADVGSSHPAISRRSQPPPPFTNLEHGWRHLRFLFLIVRGGSSCTRGCCSWWLV